MEVEVEPPTGTERATQRGQIRNKLNKKEGEFSLNKLKNLENTMLAGNEAYDEDEELITKDAGLAIAIEDDEEMNFLLSTTQDKEIEQRDIPERLQVKLAGRFDPTNEELKEEADWIFNNIQFYGSLEIIEI